MSQNYGPAVWLPADHYGFATPFQPKYIIIHATAGDRTPQAVQTTVNQRGTSVHNSIGLDGLVGQHVSYDVAAYGNGVVTGPAGKGGDGVHHDAWWDASPGGNPNNETISIEHCKVSADNSDALTPAQKAASFALVGWLCDTFGIARRWADANGGITGHFSMDPVNRSRCPGTYPWDELFAYLAGNGGQTTMADMDPAFFVAEGDGYRCTKTKQLVRGDILAAYRADDGLRRLGLPRTGEVALAGGKHGETAQLFERGVLVFDPTRAFDNPPGAPGTVYYGQVEWLLPALDPAWVASLAPKPAPPDPLKDKVFAWFQSGIALTKEF